MPQQGGSHEGICPPSQPLRVIEIYQVGFCFYSSYPLFPRQ